MYGYDWQRHKAEEELRQRIARMDWANIDDVKWRLDDVYNDNPMNVGVVRGMIAEQLRRGKLPLEIALTWVAGHNPRNDQRLIEQCMSVLVFEITTHEHRVTIMNNHRLFAHVSEYDRRRIMNAVLENGDLSRLGVNWFSHFTHLQDQLRLQPIRKEMEETHAIEFLIEGGDAVVQRIDAWLLDRLERNLGAPAKASALTSEFFTAMAVINLPGTPGHVIAQLASEAILKMVGAMPWASRQFGHDISLRTAHTQLKVLDWLIARIAGLMTSENAGVVLRWATASKRHHNWVRDRLTKAAEQHQWRLMPVTEQDGEPIVTWTTGGRTYVVRQGANPEQIGDLRVGGRAWVPRTRFLGEPVENARLLVVYQAPLHPAAMPTKAMQDNPDLFSL